MKKLLIVTLLIITVLALVLMFQLREPAPSYRTIGAEQVATSNVSEQGVGDGVGMNVPRTSGSSTRQTARERCIEAMQTAQTDRSFEPSSLLVSFAADTSFQKAVSVLASHDAAVATSSTDRDHFEENGWLEITVETGTIPQSRCALEKTVEVQSTALNTTFTLHE